MKMNLLAAATLTALLCVPGAVAAQDLSTDKGKLSYAMGYAAGQEIARAQQAGESMDMAAVLKGLQDAAAMKATAVPPEQLGAAVQAMRTRIEANYRAALTKRAAENKTQGDAYLAQNRGKPGVITLASGVQYRVLEAGNGARPTLANEVTLEFTSTLPDGTVVSDTRQAAPNKPAGPVTLRLSEVPLQGLREALQLMPAGARWQVVLPGSQAHGINIERAGELTNQVVLFDIKLVTVGKALPAPQG